MQQRRKSRQCAVVAADLRGVVGVRAEVRAEVRVVVVVVVVVVVALVALSR